VNRREFITLLGGAAAWPLAARGQQAPVAVIGVLLSGSRISSARDLQPFYQALAEAGYVEGRNLAVEYRWAEDRNDLFPELAAQLVARAVSVIVAVGSPAVAAAKAATNSIPIVFAVGVDPVLFGLVESLARPGRNLTGATNFSLEIAPKRLQLMAELLGSRRRVAVLLNARSVATDEQARSLRSAAQALGLDLHVAYASEEEELAPRFAELAQLGVAGLMIGGDPFFNSRAERLGVLSLKHALPTIYQTHMFTAAGGLISYGTSFSELYRLLGVYTGRVLKGEKPANLPVQQPAKFELIINLKTAKALGVEVPPTLLARADEVIE
jgi:putative tryptophan/tyrosine transport system substrate-binding protein